MQDIQISQCDIRNPNSLIQVQTSLPNQLSAIATNEQNDLIIGCIQGNVELKKSSGQQLSTQCHLDNEKSAIYPSNAVGIFNDDGGAVSGGGDGKVAIFNTRDGNRQSEMKISSKRNANYCYCHIINSKNLCCRLWI